MAYIGQSISTGEVEYSTGGNREPLPAGVYSLLAVRTIQKQTKGEKGPGVMVEVEFDITAPAQFSRRKFWDTFNISNPSPEATRIGLEQLAKLAKASGIPVLEDDQDLLNKEVQAEMYIGEDKKTKQLRNRVSGYYPMGVDVKTFKENLKAKAPGSASTAPAMAMAQATVAAPAAGVPSWRKPVA